MCWYDWSRIGAAEVLMFFFCADAGAVASLERTALDTIVDTAVRLERFKTSKEAIRLHLILIFKRQAVEFLPISESSRPPEQNTISKLQPYQHIGLSKK
jgi:hypothetical protein